MAKKTEEGWAALELRRAQLGDARLNRRLVRVVGILGAQPDVSVPQACGNWADTKAVYRFWDSDRVSPEAIRASHTQSTLERVKRHEMVLAIQDTTGLDFTDHPSTKGVGPMDHPARQGLKVHSVMIASTVGVPLGIVHQQTWARDPQTVGKHHKRRQYQTKDKESQRWLTALEATQELIPEGIKVLTVADREADMYDLLAMPRPRHSELLVRATHNRRVSHKARYLWDAIDQSPVRGQLTIELKRKDDQRPRTATLTVRYETLTVHPPRHRQRTESLEPIPIQVILIQEEKPPPRVTAVKWLLLTTLPLSTLQDAVQCVRWYTLRWLIERYHYVLKSGCTVEELQLETAERLLRALATYCIIAWRLLWLTYEARHNPDGRCDSVLEEHEWQSLYCTEHKTPTPPTRPPSLHEAVRWIAKFGGFLGRKHDGHPGVKTIWRGLGRLHDIAETWKLLHTEPPNHLHSTYG